MTFDPWIIGLAIGGLVAGVWAWVRERRGRQRAEAEVRKLSRRAADTAADKGRLEQRFELLADTSRDLLLVADRELELSYVNAAAEEYLGPLQSGASLIAYTHSGDLEAQVRQTIASGDSELERVVTLRDRPFHFRVRVSGGAVGVALTDAAEVQRLTRARQDLVANLSHELRTPLTSLDLLAETLLARGLNDTDLAAELVRKILSEVSLLNQMTQEMLDLSAIESGRQLARLAPVPLRDLLRQPFERLQDQAARRNVLVRNEVSQDLRVLADIDQASRAVQNVLHNALKFSPEGGAVTLTARVNSETSGVVLCLADDGPGIPPSDLGRIFERFYRGDSARGTPGTGLGLAITRHILQAHGGAAWAENRRPPHSGAAVYLRFLAA